MTDQKAYAVDDPTVIRLGRFLRNAPLKNGTPAQVPAGISELLAQAVCNYTQNLVWDHEGQRYVELQKWESLPDLEDVAVETIGDNEAVRMIHRGTGLSALGEDYDDAWKQLREKVAAHA
ncbi:hypothetical protein Y710_16325 [Gordonia sp. QH-12]|uniref:hypothetical protein n=1 Tax=Gordonia sp. QH-12 TaxID=1437876 RepID=UPI0007805851|nr:hypothetical protein [Gordonia sp. QH-12]KXT55916.1 hypothetical protein Y710_16325 [Gordonia sp. QH-12]